MQSRFRMVRCRRVFLRHRRAAVAIQAAARGAAARRLYAQMVREHHAAIVIQSRQRGRSARAGYRRSRDAVIAIQMAQRRWKVRAFASTFMQQDPRACLLLKAKFCLLTALRVVGMAVLHGMLTEVCRQSLLCLVLTEPVAINLTSETT